MAAPQQHLPTHPGPRDLLITTYIACANEGSRACATVAFGLSFGGCSNVKHFYMGSRVPNDFVQNKQVATLLAILQSLLSAPQGYDLHLIVSDPGTAFLLHNIVKELKAYTRQTRQRCRSLSSKKHKHAHTKPYSYPVTLRPELYAHLAHAQVLRGILAEVERRLRGHDEVVVVNVGEAYVRERGSLSERAHLMRATT